MKRSRLKLSFTVLMLAALACNFPAPGGDPPSDAGATPAAGSQSVTAPPPAASGPCVNPYYPAVQGATWTYVNTGRSSGAITYTDTITSVRADGFTVSTQFNELVQTQEWACTPEGLAALGLGGAGSAAALSSSGMDAEFTTSNVQGVTIPANLQPGAQWTNSFDIQGVMTIAEGQTAEASGSVSLAAQALGLESVSVPAGTFNAMKIELHTTFSITATFQGIGIPVSISGVSTLWYAPGVGMVKSTDSGEFSGSSYTSTTELQSYSIP